MGNKSHLLSVFSSIREFKRLGILWGGILALNLMAFAGKAYASNPHAITGGQTDFSAGRHILQNDFGFWAFINDGTGQPKIVFSADGVNWSAQPQQIFKNTDRGVNGLVNEVSVYYNKASSWVFVAAMENANITNNSASGAHAYVAKALL